MKSIEAERLTYLYGIIFEMLLPIRTAVAVTMINAVMTPIKTGSRFVYFADKAIVAS